MEKIDKNVLVSSISTIVSALVIAGALLYSREETPAAVAKNVWQRNSSDLLYAAATPPEQSPASSVDKDVVSPPNGAALPVTWGDLGAKLVKAGVIDANKLEAIYADRGGLGEEKKNCYLVKIRSK